MTYTVILPKSVDRKDTAKLVKWIKDTYTPTSPLEYGEAVRGEYAGQFFIQYKNKQMLSLWIRAAFDHFAVSGRYVWY